MVFVKKTVLYILAVVLLAIILAFLTNHYLYSEEPFLERKVEEVGKTSKETYENGYVVVGIGDTVVQAEVALTLAEHTKGLSGREKIEDNTGMLFVYEEPGYYSYWMPDMNFALDIIWLDSDFTVVDIKKNATPESFPEKFTPSAPAKFVLEVPSGFVERTEVEVGTQATLK